MKLALALVALTLLAYANSFQGGFVLDNRGLLLRDTRIHEASAANIRLILDHTYWWPNGESGLYRPFATLTYLFNYAVLGNGQQPAGYHWINFVLHAANVLLVYALAVRLVRRVWPAFFIAALWAVHPVLTESVTNMVGRADLLAAGAMLGAVLMYMRSVEARGVQRWVSLAGLAAITAVGVFSKESAVLIPAAIVLYELTFRGGKRWGAAQLLGLTASLVPVAFMLWQRSRVLAGMPGMEIPFTDNPIVGASFLTGRLTALGVIARYFSLIAWPANLSADYSWSQTPLARGGVQDWIVAIAVLAIVPASVLLYRWNRAAFFFFALGLGWLAPVSNLLFPIGTIMAERFLYITALGCIACLVPAIYAGFEKVGAARLAPALLCLLTVGLAARTWARNADWRDDISMASASVRSSPRSFKTHDLLANVLFAADPSHGNIERVIDESEKTRAILEPLPDASNAPDPYRFAATCYLFREAYPKAVGALLRFLAIAKAQRLGDLRQADAYRLLAAAYMGAGDTNKASDATAQARALDPSSPQVYRLRADIASSAGRMDDAATALVEGAFVTSDKSLRQALVELYRRAMDPGSCVLTPGPAGPAINPACPIVHAHVCAASAPVVRTLAAAGQRELALTRKTMFIQQFGCPRAPLDEVLPDY